MAQMGEPSVFRSNSVGKGQSLVKTEMRMMFGIAYGIERKMFKIL